MNTTGNLGVPYGKDAKDHDEPDMEHTFARYAYKQADEMLKERMKQ